MRAPTPILLLIVSLAFGTTTTSADDFTRFRGADATGVANDHPKLPDRWNKTENVAWVVDVPGQGWGSPIVAGDRVFVSSVVAEEENIKPKGGLYLGQGVRDPAKGIHHWMVYCFELNSGKELWRHEAHTGRPVVPRHPKSSYAAETPTTDGERLFVLFGDLGLYCYSLDGEPLWSKPIEPKKTNLDYGAAASPVVHDGQVFVVYDNKEDFGRPLIPLLTKHRIRSQVLPTSNMANTSDRSSISGWPTQLSVNSLKRSRPSSR